jgi:hypothetical protein
MNGNKFATGQILEKSLEVVNFKGGWAQKFPNPNTNYGNDFM